MMRTITDETNAIEGAEFNNNNADDEGGAIEWKGANGIISNSAFNNNAILGGAILWSGENGIIINSAFNNNTAESILKG